MESADNTDWFRPHDIEKAAELDQGRDDVPISATEQSATDPAQDEAVVQSFPPAATGKVPDMITPELCQESRSDHAARDALGEHMRLQAESEAELAAIEETLQTATVGDAMTLTKRKRELVDTLAHVNLILPRLRMHSDQEFRDQVSHEANAMWRPLATKRKALLAEVEIAADHLLAVLDDLDDVSAEQSTVLDRARVADPSAQMMQSDLNNSRRYLAAWLAGRLGIVVHFPAISSQLPTVRDLEATQERFINSRIL